MSTTLVISASSGFIKFVSEVVAELKRQEIAAIDTEQLQLKRLVLAEKLDNMRADKAREVEEKRAKVVQDLIGRGLGNTTICASHMSAIDRDAAIELDRATREYSRAIEEIALMEQKIAVQAGFLQKVYRWLGRQFA